MNQVEILWSVLCGPDGKCCITGSDEDRRIIDGALASLKQMMQAEPVALVDYSQPNDVCWGTDEDFPDGTPLYTHTAPQAVSAGWKLVPACLTNDSMMALAIDALESSQECISAMTDGPGAAAWGSQLDKNDHVISILKAAPKGTV